MNTEIPRYEVISASSESTVVAEFDRHLGVRESDYQTEAELEIRFIQQLESQAYERLHITSEADLLTNLRQQLERLNGITFTDGEWKLTSSL